MTSHGHKNRDHTYMFVKQPSSKVATISFAPAVDDPVSIGLPCLFGVSGKERVNRWACTLEWASESRQGRSGRSAESKEPANLRQQTSADTHLEAFHLSVYVKYFHHP